MKIKTAILFITGWMVFTSCCEFVPCPTGLGIKPFPEITYIPGVEPENLTLLKETLLTEICSLHERGDKYSEKLLEKCQQLARMRIRQFRLGEMIKQRFFVFKALHDFLKYPEKYPHVQFLFDIMPTEDKLTLICAHALTESIRREKSQDPVSDFKKLLKMSSQLSLSGLSLFINCHLYEKAGVDPYQGYSLLSKYASEALSLINNNPTLDVGNKDITVIYFGFLTIIDKSISTGNNAIRRKFERVIQSIPEDIVCLSLINYVLRNHWMTEFTPVMHIMHENTGIAMLDKMLMLENQLSKKRVRNNKPRQDLLRLAFSTRL